MANELLNKIKNGYYTVTYQRFFNPVVTKHGSTPAQNLDPAMLRALADEMDVANEEREELSQKVKEGYAQWMAKRNEFDRDLLQAVCIPPGPAADAMLTYAYNLSRIYLPGDAMDYEAVYYRFMGLVPIYLATQKDTLDRLEAAFSKDSDENS